MLKTCRISALAFYIFLLNLSCNLGMVNADIVAFKRAQPEGNSSIYSNISVVAQDFTVMAQDFTVFSATASCPPGQYTLNPDDTSCYTCPSGKFRSVPTAWAPMQVNLWGDVYTYFNRMYFNQPVYRTGYGAHFWWYYNSWYGAWGSGPCVDGCSCWCGPWYSSGFNFAAVGHYYDGQYQPISGLLGVTTNPVYCLDCPTNLICPAGTSISYKCADGRAAECSRCPAGTYTSSGNMTACTPCAKGTYNADMGATSCTECAIGTYAGATGMSACSTCPAGMYAPLTGLSACLYCDSGV